MSNSEKKRKSLITPEKAASFIPVFISSIIGIFIILFFVLPQYFKSVEVDLELKNLIKKKNELENLKSQYKIINKKFDKLNKEKSRIIALITGKSNLDTLLANIGEIGKKNKIVFISVSPKKIITFVDKGSLEENKNNNLNMTLDTDPLLVRGIEKYVIEMTFETTYKYLLSFLRDLEFQENIILFDDLNVKLIGNKIKNNEGSPIQVEFIMSYYGKT